MQSNKSTRKRQPKVQIAPRKLVSQKWYEFYVPLPMQECVVRLKTVTEEEVYLSPDSPTKIEFHFVQRGSTFGQIWSVGHIQELDESRSRIFGKTGLPEVEMKLIFMICAAAFGILILNNLSSWHGTCLALVIAIPIVAIAVSHNYSRGRDSLMEKLRSIKTAEQPK